MVDYIAKVELLAELFYADTGMMAPGKSEPMEMNSVRTPEERAEAYREWYAAKALDQVLARCLKAEKELAELRDRVEDMAWERDTRG